jgi:hypothetical protein
MHNDTPSIEALRANVAKAQAAVDRHHRSGNTGARHRAEGRLAGAQSALRMGEARAEALAALQGNRCPCCGRGVRRNLSLTGWVQCEQFGAEQFRKDPAQPACSWQGFYQ